ncbi:FAD-dependent oxidoreductase [Methylocystis parvus]|uniref:FAD-dependent oxidoreductase n=1 Tax=Methylocystis parvus TaxID=134 RepID=UPI003C743BAB
MNVSGERSKAIWSAVDFSAPMLETKITTEVAVIGSGIAGLSVAYELAKAGKNVVVVDRGPIGGGMTARTTAHLSSYCDDGFRELIDMRGLDIARGWQESQAAAIARIEANVQALAADCDFRRLDAFLFLAQGSDPAIIDRELVASAQVGMIALRHGGVPFAGYETAPTLQFPQQATFHPTKYLSALAKAIRNAGGRFFANSIVVSVEEKNKLVTIKTANGEEIEASAAVVATNAPITDRIAISSKQAPYRTYAVAFEIARGSLPDALYWDTLDPYHYVRLQRGEAESDMLIVGGEDHKTGEANDGQTRILSLSRWMRELFPALGQEIARWSGQVLEPVDYVGFIGRNPGDDHIYVATGDSGQGMTHGAAAGLVISDLILKGDSPWRQVYDPSRKPVKALGEFVKENATAVKSFVEYLAPGELSSLDELKAGEGAIVRDGFYKIAAYRDETGALMKRSAACTHVGCHVRWNSFERCWDCPCHGSQFAPDGEALNAPAFSALGEAEN